MLSQRLKENTDVFSFNPNIQLNHKQQSQKTKNQNMLYKAIEILKSQKQIIIKQKQAQARQFHREKSDLKSQIQYYKNKLSQMSESTIIQTILNGPSEAHHRTQKQQENYAAKKLQIEVDHLKANIKDKDRAIAKLQTKNKQLSEMVKQTLKQKQKNMQISLTEKITQEQKIDLLEKDLVGKKRIIEGLQKQIGSVANLQKNLLKQQQQLVKRTKDMEKFQEQFQSYYKHNQQSYQNKVKVLGTENAFLKKQIKKVLKQVKKSCKCEGQAEQWKQKLFKIGRQLAHARVQLSKNHFNKQRNIKSPKGQINEDSSLDSLVLSDGSDTD